MKKRYLLITSIIVLGGIVFLLSKMRVRIDLEPDLNLPKGKEIEVVHKFDIENSEFYQVLNHSKIIVLNLWATWCKPCVGEIPELNNVKKNFPQYTYLSLSIDRDTTTLNAFNRLNKFQFKDITIANLVYRKAIINFLENEKLDHTPAIQSVPITYLIQDGKVIKKWDGTIDADDIEDELEKING